MTEPTDLSVIRGKKKEQEICLYCGGDTHEVILACPRIAHITIEDGEIVGISFWQDFYEFEPDGAA